MKEFQAFLGKMADPSQKARMENILHRVKEKFPDLQEEIKWNQPMFTSHGTFIIGFSFAKGHIAVAPEAAAIARFSQRIVQARYTHTKELFRIKWTDPVDFDLLFAVVAFNMEDKKDTQSFWRR